MFANIIGFFLKKFNPIRLSVMDKQYEIKCDNELELGYEYYYYDWDDDGRDVLL